MDLKLYRILIVIQWLHYSFGYSDTKINVAFVIDDTGSMQQEIDQVKEKTQFIFNTVLKHNNSQIENFILITFNDYNVYDIFFDKNYDDYSRKPIKTRAITRDPNIFYDALDEIKITDRYDGGDCPELALKGLREAIINSKPNSYIYVFTDASSKDLELESEVKSLALSKSIQITFILTGHDCNYAYLTYDKEFVRGLYKRLAVATSGEVFQLTKSNVNQMIIYITDSVQDPKTTLLSKEVKPGVNTYNFTVDDDMMSILISISIENEWTKIYLYVTDPNGNNAPTIDVVQTESIKAVKINEPKVGVYQIKANMVPRSANSYQDTSIGGIVIRASINIDFQYNFLNATSMTKTSPIAGELSNMEIFVKIPRQVNFKLEKVLFLNTNYTILKEMSNNHIISQNKTVYIIGPFRMPHENFKIEIFGVNLNTGSTTKRIGRTFVNPEPRDYPKIDKTNNSVAVPKGSMAVISCRTGKIFPIPNMTWEFRREGSGIFERLSVTDQEIHIDSADLDDAGAYKCQARNEVGTDSHEITLNVHYSPTVASIYVPKMLKTGGDIIMSCNTTAEPAPKVKWLKNGKSIGLYKKYVTWNNSLRFIADLGDSGNYTCVATNNYGSDSKTVTIVIHDSPQIDKSKLNFEVKEGSTAVISCRIVKGSPLPTITWEFKRHDTNQFEKLLETKHEVQISRVGLNSAGVYKCVATNVAGRDSHEIKLNVKYYPSIDKTYNSVTVTKGSIAVISCRIRKIFPIPNITWEFKRQGNGIFERLSVTDKKIHISSADLDDAGVFKCQARNEVGTDSHEITLNVHYSPTVASIYVPKMLKTGGDIIMSCNTTAEPAPKVKWLKNGKSIGLYKKYVTWNNSLRFIADLGDSGNYTCVATNNYGSDSKTVTIVIHESPKIDKSKLSIEVKEGSTAVISCRIVKGSPLPTITWEFKRHDTNQFEKLLETKHEIQISRVGLNSAGVYKCVATNVAGRDSHEIKLNVKYYPSIDKTDGSLTVIRGSRAVIPCRTRKLLPIPNRTWDFKKQGSHIFKRLSVTDQEIHIDLADLDDAGVYKCQAINEVGTDSHEIALIVQYTPTVILQQPKMVKTGDDVILACQTTGEPTPIVNWFKDGKSVDLNKKHFVNEKNSLRFIADLNDVGNYTCKAENVLGTDSKSVKVDVYDPVEIENPGKTEFNIVKYDMVLKLPCKAKGFPKPTVTWAKDDVPLVIDYPYDQEIDNTLVRNYPDLSSTGNYTCTARNNIHSVTQVYTVNVSQYPIPSEPMRTLYLEKETSNPINCNVPHSDFDYVRWFTNGIQIETTDGFVLRNASEKDNGIYSCRVDFDWGSESNHTRIIVGTKPRFIKDLNNEKVPFIEGQNAYLDCTVTGDPSPKITWWHNENKLQEISMIYKLEMKTGDTGTWRCEAENPIDIITRTYLIET